MHRSCSRAIAAEPGALIVPQVVLPEICYLLNSRHGAEAELRFVRGLEGSDWLLEPLATADLARTAELLEVYWEANLGYVDAALVAIAERLGVTRIFTLDHQHFGIVRPRHADAFQLLPD
jgi:predicted nucleic acid-binding protein